MPPEIQVAAEIIQAVVDDDGMAKKEGSCLELVKTN